MVISASELRIRKLYWKRVSMCLVAFHKYQPTKADEAITELQKRFPLKSSSPIVELLYHEEPFRLACKLTHSKMSVKSHIRKYQEILESTADPSEVRKTGKYRTVGEALRSGLKSRFEVREEPQKLKKDKTSLRTAASSVEKKAKRTEEKLKTATTSKASATKKLVKKQTLPKKAASSKKRFVE